jgi:hypothetical protein
MTSPIEAQAASLFEQIEYAVLNMMRTGDSTKLAAAKAALGQALAGTLPQPVATTPAAQWREKGEPDPHGDRYDCERAALCMGDLSDDELANGAFMNYDHRPSPQEIIAGTAHSPIAWMTAVKDRIRWLSRKLAASASIASADPATVAAPEGTSFISVIVNGHPRTIKIAKDSSLRALVIVALQAAKVMDYDLDRWMLSDEPGNVLDQSRLVASLDERAVLFISRAAGIVAAAAPAPMVGLTEEEVMDAFAIPFFDDTPPPFFERLNAVIRAFAKKNGATVTEGD